MFSRVGGLDGPDAGASGPLEDVRLRVGIFHDLIKVNNNNQLPCCLHFLYLLFSGIRLKALVLRFADLFNQIITNLRLPEDWHCKVTTAFLIIKIYLNVIKHIL